jgi:hypothetical protein
MMAQPKVLSSSQERSIAKKYAKGAQTGALAAQFGVHRDTIRASVTRQGGTLRTRGGQPGVPRGKPAAKLVL